VGGRGIQVVDVEGDVVTADVAVAGLGALRIVGPARLVLEGLDVGPGTRR